MEESRVKKRILQGANRCAFFADKIKVAQYYSPIRMIADALASGQHYTNKQLRELCGTSCARKSISLLREKGWKIRSKRIPHKHGTKEYWLEKE